MKKYKLVYQDKEAKKIKGSLTGIVGESDVEIYDYADFKEKGIKKVYEADGKIKFSKTGFVSADDEVALDRAELESAEEEGDEEGDDDEEEGGEDEDQPVAKEFTIVDATNFNEARHTILEDYYNCWPVEAEQDGEEWPAWNPAAFPWIVINHEFDGHTRVIIKLDGVEKENYVPSAKTGENEDVDRTWSILSLADIAGPEYAYKTNNPGPNADWSMPDEVFEESRLTVEIVNE